MRHIAILPNAVPLATIRIATGSSAARQSPLIWPATRKSQAMADIKASVAAHSKKDSRRPRGHFDAQMATQKQQIGAGAENRHQACEMDRANGGEDRDHGLTVKL